MYLPKLNETILKYSSLNLFKEIVIGFNDGLKSTLASPANPSDDYLV